ncbi:hypothetical protein LV35_04198 [Acinetobacter baumannii]|uniref:Uncharacterized protein n=1 Tax=Acinetobacter baumannii TaxID=470 RepID=A0AAJ0VMB9_ACIBA|nr:hypothetical protein LV35_04198 [Acinetobacter baumannii]
MLHWRPYSSAVNPPPRNRAATMARMPTIMGLATHRRTMCQVSPSMRETAAVAMAPAPATRQMCPATWSSPRQKVRTMLSPRRATAMVDANSQRRDQVIHRTRRLQPMQERAAIVRAVVILGLQKRTGRSLPSKRFIKQDQQGAKKLLRPVAELLYGRSILTGAEPS